MPKKSKKQVKPPVKQNGLEKNEKLLLQIYVHFPDYRYSIIHTLNTFNVFLGLSISIRLGWSLTKRSLMIVTMML